MPSSVGKKEYFTDFISDLSEVPKIPPHSTAVNPFLIGVLI